MGENGGSSTFLASWQERIRALSNVPPLIGIVWQSGPAVVSGGLFCRITVALLPLAMLGVSKKILDAIQIHSHGQPLPGNFWLLVGAEFALASVGGILGRTIGYFDALLADRFTRHVSIRVMEHASRLGDSGISWLYPQATARRDRQLASFR